MTTGRRQLHALSKLPLILLLLPLVPSTAWADEEADAPHEEQEAGWEGLAQFHLFLPLLSHGKARVREQEVDLDDLEVGALGWGGRFELHSPWRLGAVVDAFYATQTVDADAPLALASGTTSSSLTATSAHVKRFSVDVLATCEVVTLELAELVELKLGAAVGAAWVIYYTAIDARLQGLEVTLAEDDTALELVLGVDLELGLLDELLALIVQTDLGGFGIGDASALTWKLVVALRARPLEFFSVEAGYRGLFVEYEGPADNVALETNLHGLYLALSLHF